jgi:hypothetical protein
MSTEGMKNDANASLHFIIYLNDKMGAWVDRSTCVV